MDSEPRPAPLKADHIKSIRVSADGHVYTVEVREDAGCDGGTLSLEDAEALRLPAASERIKGVKVVPFYDLGDYAKPYQARRIRAAVVNRCAGRYLTPLIKGEPAAEPAD
ncbi:hypothetical protein ADK70_40020 [Streptomyces rimosus subsp. pseudoverticillatus]|uniref:hypothetical protein n=1 Tax=Streptomyces rimosus TaxID=1927 RepID=UPI0006C18702|nr:hypothetical protein [Streptomyces rimosus]KOT75344.1 hypothetical protein ADK70_40020 [Streptomyces rimosus subsp. pseudoverticillatus]